MPFPTTGTLDNFNRADEGPPPSASWNTVGAMPGLQVEDNECRANAVGSASRWDTSFTADCEAYFTIKTLPNDLSAINLYLRTPGDLGSGSAGYSIQVFRDDTGPATDALTIFRRSGAGNSSLTSPYSFNFQVGDSFGIRAIGDLIEAYYKPVGSVWTRVLAVTNSVWTSGGYIILSIEDTTAFVDDFGGGDIVTTSSTIVVTDSLFLADVNEYPLFPITDTLTLTDEVVSIIDDTLTLTEVVEVTMPDPLIIEDNLYLYEVIEVAGAPVTPPDDPATGGVGSIGQAVLRLLYGNDKRNPIRELDLAETMPGNIYLQAGGFAPGSGELNELWTDDSIRQDGQKKLGESRKNSNLSVKYVLQNSAQSQAALSYYQHKIATFFMDAKRYQVGNEGHKVWLEYRWADGLNTLPRPTFGQLSGYYEVISVKSQKWPDDLHGQIDNLGQGVISDTVLNLVCSPVSEGIKQRAGIAGGVVSLNDKGVLIASGSSSKLHWPAYTSSGLTGQFTITGWMTLNTTWSSGTKYIFDYYYNASNRISIVYDRDNTRWTITKIVSGTPFTANSSTDTITNGDDVHLILTQDATTLRLYVNGVSVAFVAATATMTDGGLIALGCPGTGTIDGVDVILDGWRILPDDITSTQAVQVYGVEKPIKDDGGMVGPPPFWWTKDSDGMIDNSDDSTHDNWGLIGGVGGDIEAELSIYFVASSSINGRTFWIGRKDQDSSFTPSGYLWFTTPFIKSSLDRTKIFGRYRRLVRCYLGAAGTITHGWGNYNSNYYFQPRTVSVTNTSYKLLDFGDYFIHREDTLTDTIAVILFDITSGSLTKDFSFLLPAPYVKLVPKVSINSNTGMIIENGSAFITDSPDTGARGDKIEYNGDPITAIPGKYNYLFALQQEAAGDIDTSKTATVTVYVTPRYLLPGGMVA